MSQKAIKKILTKDLHLYLCLVIKTNKLTIESQTNIF